MLQTASRNHKTGWVSLFLMLAILLVLPVSGWTADDRQLDSGPFSLSLRGGAENNTGALGVDGRVDYLNRVLNLHLFGTFDWLDAGSGEGRISNTRYGGGVALSHTFARRANVFAGTSLIREMDKNFAHAYLGGKVKLTDYAILSASYGFGFDKAKELQRFTSSYLAGEAVDWLKVGGVLVSGQGLKANVYYHLTDPANEKISGIEGELSYAVLDNLTAGANIICDLTERAALERNWRSFLFVTFAFGSQKGSPIDIALDKNNPIEYPQIIRKVVQQAGTPAPPPPPATPLIISPDPAHMDFCAQPPPYSMKFTVSGGTEPYEWTISDGSTLVPGGTVVQWQPVNTFTGSGPTLTVRDANNNTKSVTITGFDLCPF